MSITDKGGVQELGHTALHIAAKRGRLDVVEALIEKVRVVPSSPSGLTLMRPPPMQGCTCSAWSLFASSAPTADEGQQQAA